MALFWGVWWLFYIRFLMPAHYKTAQSTIEMHFNSTAIPWHDHVSLVATLDWTEGCQLEPAFTKRIIASLISSSAYPLCTYNYSSEIGPSFHGAYVKLLALLLHR